MYISQRLFYVQCGHRVETSNQVCFEDVLLVTLPKPTSMYPTYASRRNTPQPKSFAMYISVDASATRSDVINRTEIYATDGSNGERPGIKCSICMILEAARFCEKAVPSLIICWVSDVSTRTWRTWETWCYTALMPIYFPSKERQPCPSETRYYKDLQGVTKSMLCTLRPTSISQVIDTIGPGLMGPFQRQPPRTFSKSDSRMQHAEESLKGEYCARPH